MYSSLLIPTMHLRQCVPSSELSPQSSFPSHTWVIFKQWDVPTHCHWFGEHVTGPGGGRQESKTINISINSSGEGNSEQRIQRRVTNYNTVYLTEDHTIANLTFSKIPLYNSWLLY